jgi:hypothetical protein
MAEVDNAIRTLVEIPADFSDRRIPAGAYGTIIEKYDEPEGYIVDVVVARPDVVGGYSFENVVLTPDKFEVVSQIPESVYDQFGSADG